MASDDIYRIEIHYEGPSQAASTSLYYFEDGPRSEGISDTEQLNEAFQTAFIQDLRGVLSDDWKLVSSEVHKVFGNVVPMDLREFSNPAGNRPGPSLPANNAMILSFTQITVPRRANGRVFLPGIAEGDTATGVLSNAFIIGNANALATRMGNQLSEVGGSGTWLPIVISATRRDAQPGIKDWPGAVGSVISVDVQPLIARQIRRATKVRGVFG